MPTGNFHSVETACPHCGKRTPDHANADGETDAPSDGDFSICMYCGKLAIYCRGPFGLATRLPTDVEQAAADSHPMMPEALAIKLTDLHWRYHL